MNIINDWLNKNGDKKIAEKVKLILSGVSQRSELLSCDNGCYWALKEADNKQYLQCSICERIEAT
jgi:hypothetical protein